MKILQKYFFLIALFSAANNCLQAQNNKTDSLAIVFKNATHDTIRITALNNLSEILWRTGEYDSAMNCATRALALADKVLNSNSTETFKKGIEKRKSVSYTCIGSIYRNWGNFDKALEFQLMALKIREQGDDKRALAYSYNSIGIIYWNKGEYNKALDYYFKTLKLREELNDKFGAAICFGNIGLTYSNLGDYDKALEYNFKSLGILEQLGEKRSIASANNNIGLLYQMLGEKEKVKTEQTIQYDKALAYYFKSIKIKEEIDDQKGIGSSLNNIGVIYLQQGKIKLAKEQELKALAIAIQFEAKEDMYFAYGVLAQCDSALGNFKQAYEYHKLYSQLKDSVFNAESEAKTAEMTAKYESEKQQQEIILLQKDNEKKEALANEESKKQKIIIGSVAGGLLLVIFFSIILFTRLRITRTQKKVIENQKVIVEEKQKEILDSIRYAKRIQQSLLPTEKYIDKSLKRLKR